MPKYIEAAEAFRALLRTERYPVGAEIAAIPEINQVTGAPHNTAARALAYLGEQGELLVRPGKPTVVLPPPDDAVRDIETALAAIDFNGEALRSAVRRSRLTSQARGLELVRRTVAWIQGSDWLYPEQLEEGFIELQRRLDAATPDDETCPVCQKGDQCDTGCPLRTVRG